MGDSVDMYIDLDQKNIHKDNGIESYFIQRTLWPDDKDIPTRPLKAIEYEAGYQLFLCLADRIIVTHQKSILNKKVDMIFELRDVLDLDIPSIGVEINEDRHVAYNKEDEKHRAEVVKYFDNILYEIPISRSASLEETKNTVKEYVIKIPLQPFGCCGIFLC
jgi:hypothetical protein